MLRFGLISYILLSVLISSCSSLIPQPGPSTFSVKRNIAHITLVNLTPYLVSKLSSQKDTFRDKTNFFLTEAYTRAIGKGDTLEITIYEAPPNVLLTTDSSLIRSKGISTLKSPHQIVDDQGYINVPFAGRIYVLGKRPEEVAREIEAILSKKANKPQVIVNIAEFLSSTVTVFGHVKKSGKVPLSYSTTTLLDVLASAGGVTSPINKTLIQVVRGRDRIILPLEDVISDPTLNINLKPRDIITVIYRTQSATILGATGKNMELEFEARGISASQALGRAGGLKDDIAHVKGLFIFRFEDKHIMDRLKINYSAYTKSGKVPVVYNIDMSKPESMLVLREFQLKDKDILYVSTAPSVQLEKFLGIVRDIIQPIFMIDVISKTR